MTRPILAALLCLGLASPLTAQTVIDRVQTGNGARALGMGYAFTAIADDATAIGWNPAGLAQLLLPEASLVASVRGQYPELNFTGLAVDGTTGRFATSSVPLSFASIVYPTRLLGRPVTAGLAYRMMYDWARAADYSADFSAGVESGTIRERLERTGGIRAISPAVGIELHPKVRIGATVNLLSGRTVERTTTTRSGNLSNPGTTTTTATTDGYRGTAIEVGTLLHPSEALRIGLRVGLPYDRVSDARIDGTARPRARLEVPMTFSGGLALRIDDHSQVAFDVRHEPWTQGLQRNDVTGAVTVDPASPNDATSYHIGYETVRETRTVLNATRIGFFNRPSTFDDNAGEQITGLGASFGKGWATQKFAFDLAATYIRVNDRQINAGTDFEYRVVENELLLTASLVVYLK